MQIISKMQKYEPLLQACPTHKEPLIMLCLHDECQQRGVICAHCEYESHKHPIRPLGAVFSEITRDLQLDSITLLSRIDNLYSSIEAETAKIAKVGDRMLLGEMIQRYYQFLCNKIRTMAMLAGKLINKEAINSIEDLNTFLLKYEFMDRKDFPADISNLQIFIKHILQGFETVKQEFQEAIKNGDELKRILEIFVIDEERASKYVFSNEKKHPQIFVEKKKVEIKTGYTYRIALLDPPIHKEGCKSSLKKTCTFRVNKINSMVGVGVVFRNKSESAAYLFSAYSDHGCYFIANNGYTYNEVDPNYNSQVKNWTYLVDELIKVTIDPKKKVIVFCKEGVEPFEFKYEDRPEMELNFGVMVCSGGESIEVV